jgi:GT2 family glycosyltransferase
MENPNLIKPKYSVVLLIFHRTKELVDMARDCVASINNSSKDFELIIVDNGSTERYEWEKHCDVYIRLDRNMGISHGWNTGLRIARANYITILGDDTIVHEGWLEELQKAMDMPQAGLANIYVEHLPQGVGIVENYKWFSHACVMLTKKTIARVGYYDQDTYFPCNFEDHDYISRVLRAGLKCYVNYGCSIQHKEGQTLHAKDLSQHFISLKQKFMDKWGFDNQAVFCGDQPFPFV